MEKNYKIVHGYGEFDYIPVHTKELPKAYYAFRQGSNLITDGGDAIRGKDIRLIEYNWRNEVGFDELTEQNKNRIKRLKENKADILRWADNVAQLAIENKNTSILKDYEAIEKSYRVEVQGELLQNDNNTLSIDTH